MSSRADTVLGLDIGSGSVKGLLLDGSGRVEASATCAFSTSHPAPGQAEQSPDEWFAAVVEVVDALTRADPSRAARLRGIGLTGAAHIPVLLDARLQVVRPAILWSDMRSAAEAVELERVHGSLIRDLTFNSPSPTWTLPQLLWLRRHEPEAMGDVRHLLLGKDEIIRRLTGRLVADQGNAASSLMLDVNRMRWSDDLVGLSGLQVEAMPEVVTPSEVVGSLSRAAAELLRLPAGLPVVAGGLDSVMELVALGVTQPGQAMLRLGTAGGIMAIATEGRAHHGLITYPYLDRGWCSQAFTSSCASSLQWMAGVLSRQDGMNEASTLAFEDLDALAAAVDPGADGVIFHPYLMGERAPHWNPELRASFIGLASGHGPGHLVRAVMEGVACSIRDCLDLLETLGGPLRSLRATGGMTQSDVWSHIVCDVLGRPFTPGQAEGSAMGAAMITATSLGMFPGLEEAVAACAEAGPVVDPDPASRGTYDRLIEVYRRVTEALAPIYTPTTHA